MTESPPRFCCMNARNVVISLCVSNIIGDLFKMFEGGHFQFLAWVSCFLEVTTLVGVLTNNVLCLKKTVLFALINLIFVCVMMLTIPVSMAAIYSSEYDRPPITIYYPHGFSEDLEQGEKDVRLAHGLAAGYLMEIGIVIVLLSSYAKYVLVKRVYLYAKDKNAPTPIYTSV